MLIGVIADDFTGASDIASTLAKGTSGQGLRVCQYDGVPANPATDDIEAGVISLKSRSIASELAIEQSLAALDWLKSQGCKQIIFKYCSTFDSTPEGNIGPVGEALADKLGVKGVITCPAFPTLGRTIHQGHLFVNDRLLSESGMQNHPLTPMTDPDLRRWLTRQCAEPVGLVPSQIVRKGKEAIQEALLSAGKQGETLVITDAATDEDLIVLAQAAKDLPFLTGGSGIALGLPDNFIKSGQALGQKPNYSGLKGTAAILAGSCSGATLGQVEKHALDHPTFTVSAVAVMQDEISVKELCDFVFEHFNEAPLIYSSGTPEEVTKAQEQYGRETIANKLETLFAQTAVELINTGVTKLVVAGGETSSAVTQALNLGALRIGPEIDPGVPILIADQHDIALALKSGNFGGVDFFARAVQDLDGQH